jgi:hypothetical protein
MWQSLMRCATHCMEAQAKLWTSFVTGCCREAEENLSI